MLQPERDDAWIQTWGGHKFWPLDPRPEDIHIRDIAQGLSQKCRYNGQCHGFYSVAQHSVLMAESPEVPEPVKLWALLHDGTEAYLPDIPSPIKPRIPGFGEIEAKLMLAICKRYGLPPDMPASVKSADIRICGDEIPKLMLPDPDWKLPKLPPLGVFIVCWPPVTARRRFPQVFERLTGQVV